MHTTDTSHGRVDRDDLLARTDLAQVLDALTVGCGEGRRRTWSCPDRGHPDTHPSVTIATDRRGVQRWRCWSGGHGGTAIDAVMASQGLGAREAIGWLNDHYVHLEPLRHDPPPPRRPVGEPAPEVVEYVERCEKLLWTPAGRTAREWLNARGYPDELLKANHVGADPGRRYLPRPKGFPGGWPAVVYPARGDNGGIVYFQARYLDPPEGRGKYDAPSGQWATNPRYGWIYPINRRADTSGTIVITEGIPDALAAASLGYHAVGVLGTTMFNTAAASRIRSGAPLAKRFVVCFDGDGAGRAGARRVADELHKVGVNVEIVDPPEGLDLTDWLTHLPRDWAGGLDPLRGARPDPVGRTDRGLSIA